ncbi:hypothetical protein KIPB_003192 [Kipferlia bialata]|uniref:Uncharacterized protein n=1 Tax=Kipferlia bialata TaxID=797122 RepID=A0A9K3GFL6_9EUKA|nr:hypothetical protein KIPB_003192 [Kipferlia bialata]|eukprot:g3192.t1
MHPLLLMTAPVVPTDPKRPPTESDEEGERERESDEDMEDYEVDLMGEMVPGVYAMCRHLTKFRDWQADPEAGEGSEASGLDQFKTDLFTCLREGLTLQLRGMAAIADEDEEDIEMDVEPLIREVETRYKLPPSSVDTALIGEIMDHACDAAFGEMDMGEDVLFDMEAMEAEEGGFRAWRDGGEREREGFTQFSGWPCEPGLRDGSESDSFSEGEREREGMGGGDDFFGGVSDAAFDAGIQAQMLELEQLMQRNRDMDAAATRQQTVVPREVSGLAEGLYNYRYPTLHALVCAMYERSGSDWRPEGPDRLECATKGCRCYALYEAEEGVGYHLVHGDGAAAETEGEVKGEGERGNHEEQCKAAGANATQQANWVSHIIDTHATFSDCDPVINHSLTPVLCALPDGSLFMVTRAPRPKEFQRPTDPVEPAQAVGIVSLTSIGSSTPTHRMLHCDPIPVHPGLCQAVGLEGVHCCGRVYVFGGKVEDMSKSDEERGVRGFRSGPNGMVPTYNPRDVIRNALLSYDLALGEWQEVVPAEGDLDKGLWPPAMSDLGIKVEDFEDKLWVFGKLKETAYSDKEQTEVWCMDPDTHRWTKADMALPLNTRVCSVCVCEDSMHLFLESDRKGVSHWLYSSRNGVTQLATTGPFAHQPPSTLVPIGPYIIGRLCTTVAGADPTLHVYDTVQGVWIEGMPLGVDVTGMQMARDLVPFGCHSLMMSVNDYEMETNRSCNNRLILRMNPELFYPHHSDTNGEEYRWALPRAAVPTPPMRRGYDGGVYAMVSHSLNRY